ncbi:MAG: AmmeMemoRadiSam system protein B [Candidatus Omnitrophota bacterium]
MSTPLSRYPAICIALVLFTASGSAESIQKPVVAGSFYPAESVILARQVDKYLEDAEPKQIDGEIVALISPHAGYEYSGPVAAYGYKAVSGRKYDTVVVIAPSHRLVFDGATVLEKDSYETPLGTVPIDVDFVKKLMRAEKVTVVSKPQAFEEEHSLEVQIPFLQRSLKDFKLVPVVIGRPDYNTCIGLTRGLVKVIKASGKRVLIVASTDLSHYYKYDDAVVKDQATISEIMNYDPGRLAGKIGERECELCGSAPVIVAMLAGKELGAGNISVLKYANSGDTAGDKSRVVGYASIVIYKAEETKMLTSAQKKELLGMARKTIESCVKAGKAPEFKTNDPALTKQEGAFVTIHKNGELRGCIGNIIGQQPLYLTVRDMAIESSTADPRFTPVGPEELKDIKIEISVLSEPRRVRSADEIRMGEHGVIVKSGYRSGVFLPQVATETGWSREEFLSNLCENKAGLPADAWKDKKTELYVFTAQVFSE